MVIHLAFIPTISTCVRKSYIVISNMKARTTAASVHPAASQLGGDSEPARKFISAAQRWVQTWRTTALRNILAVGTLPAN